jgi:hypothetical protein
MGDKESKAYRKLSAAGKTAYGRDRAKEADANQGTFSATLAKLYAGDYNSL